MTTTAAMPPYIAYPPATYGPQAIPRYDTCAVVSLLCGLLGLGLPALVFGSIGVWNTSRCNERGFWTAGVGMLLGLLETGAVIVVVWMFWANLSNMHLWQSDTHYS
jgi:hypothetical protein